MTSYTKQSTRHQISMQRQAHAWAHIHMIHRLIKQLDGKDLPLTRGHAVRALPEYASEVWRVCAAEPPSEALKQRAASEAIYLSAQMHRMDPSPTGDEWESLVVAGRKLAGVGGLK